jgi:hypothetical protein
MQVRQRDIADSEITDRNFMGSLKDCRNITLRFIRRTRALLLVVIATAVITTLLPLTSGPVHAATMLPANESVLSLRADQVNGDSGPGTRGCKVPARKVPATSQPALLRAIEVARVAGVAVPTEERAHDGTTVVSYAISDSRDPAIPRRPADAWWIYVTYVAVPCHNISEIYTDFSAVLNHEMVKAAAKHATKISAFLGTLSGILSPFLSHLQIGVIISVITGVLGLAGMTLVKFYTTIRKYVYHVQGAKHKLNTAGWYAHEQSDIVGNDYVNDAFRSCVAGWWELKCGSAGHLAKGERE